MLNNEDFRDVVDKSSVRITPIFGQSSSNVAVLALYSVYELKCNLDLAAFPFDVQVNFRKSLTSRTNLFTLLRFVVRTFPFRVILISLHSALDSK